MENSKKVCPVCGNRSASKIFDGNVYYCMTPNCSWRSDYENTIDISYSDNKSAVLSNLFPNKFVIHNVTCLSMESFIQSLREEDTELQNFICSNYSGFMAYKMRLSLRDWRKSGIVYWKGEKIFRNSEEYTDLISIAYHCLYEQNQLFRTILQRNKDKYLVHTIGCDDKTETLLTEEEYRYQLNNLLKDNI